MNGQCSLETWLTRQYKAPTYTNVKTGTVKASDAKPAATPQPKAPRAT